MFAAKQASGTIHQTTSKKLTEEAVYMICVMLTFVGLAILGSSITAYDFFFSEKKYQHLTNGTNGKVATSTRRTLKEKYLITSHDCKSFLKCFCLVKNGTKVLSIASTENQISCFQGLKFICSIAVICIHIITMFICSQIHLDKLKPFLDTRASHIFLNAMSPVDIFFIMSGFLNANAFFHKYSTSNGNISWFQFYFKRFARLTPVYMIVLGFYATLFSYTGNGFLWPNYFTNPACQKDWLWHLLYINNFEESTRQCFTWGWSLAADMQFYIISPLFMIPLIRWPRLGCALMLASISGSCLISSSISYKYSLIDGFARFEFHLDDARNFVSKFWKYFDMVYSKPYTRICPYLIAIILAHYLYKRKVNKDSTKNNAMTLCCGWSITALFLYLYFFSLYKRDEKQLMVTAFYNGTKNLLCSASFAWIIYLCLTGQSEFLNKFLSWKYFLPLSRLSYCAYLIHPIIMIRLLLQAQDLLDFSFTSTISLCLYCCVFTYAVSFLVSIFFECPLSNLVDWFSAKKGEKNSSKIHSN